MSPALLQTLANGGEIDGVRLLSPKTVRYMLHVDHLDGLSSRLAIFLA